MRAHAGKSYNNCKSQDNIMQEFSKILWHCPFSPYLNWTDVLRFHDYQHQNYFETTYWVLGHLFKASWCWWIMGLKMLFHRRQWKYSNAKNPDTAGMTYLGCSESIELWSQGVRYGNFNLGMAMAAVKGLDFT